MKVDNSAQIRNRIEELKRGKHAVILAHYRGMAGWHAVQSGV